MKKLAAISFLALLINAQIKPCIEDSSNAAVGTSNIQRTYSRETTFFPSQGGSATTIKQTSEQKTNERLSKIEQMIQATQQKSSTALTAGVAIGSVATAMVFVVANLTVLRRGA